MKNNDNIDNEFEGFEEEHILILEDESGKQIEFFLIAQLPYKDDWYVFLEPKEHFDTIQEDEVVIFKIGQDDEGSDVFLTVDDQKIVDEVFQEFLKMADSE